MNGLDKMSYGLYGMVLSIVLVIALLLNNLLTNYINTYAQNQAQNYAETISTVIIQDYMAKDWLSLTQKLKTLFKEPSIIYIAVIDNNGQTVSTYRSSQFQDFDFDVSDQPPLVGVEYSYRALVPITFDQSVLGQLQLAINADFWFGLKSKLNFFLALIALIGLSLSYILSYFSKSKQLVEDQQPVMTQLKEAELEFAELEIAKEYEPVLLEKIHVSVLILNMDISESDQETVSDLDQINQLIKKAAHLYSGIMTPMQGARINIYFGLTSQEPDHPFKALCAAQLMSGLLKQFGDKSTNTFWFSIGLDVGQVHYAKAQELILSYHLEQRAQALLNEDIVSLQPNPVRATIRFANHPALKNKSFTDHRNDSLAIWLESNYEQLVNNQIKQLAQQ